MLQIRKEFRREYFGFCDISPRAFYCSKWFNQRSFFVAYRVAIFTYCLVWAVTNRMYYSYSYPESIAVAFLSNWAEWLQTFNFGILFLVSVYGLVCAHVGTSDHEGILRWFHQMSWMLQTMSITGQYVVTVMYWSTVSSDDTTAMAVVVHQHAINSVLATIDLMMCGIPIRLLHFIYSAAFGLFYIIVTLTLHGSGTQSEFYMGVLDWKDYPGQSVGICLGVLLIGTPVLHCVSYLVYLLREKIKELVGGGEAKSEKSEVVEADAELLDVGERDHKFNL